MVKKIRVAIVAPSFGDTGGPEVVVQNLTDALLELSVDVTLFAPGDWETKAKHVHTLEQSLWNMENFKQQTEEERRSLIIESQLKVLEYQNNFDIIHLHSQRYAHLVAQKTKKPCVLTFHNKIAEPQFGEIKKAGIFAVALSDTHDNDLGADAVIENGIPVRKMKPSFEKGEYLIAIGRLIETKGIDVAIKIANKAKKKLLIFGRVGNATERQEYFNKKIKPFLNKNILLMGGEVPQIELFEYIRKAEALLFPLTRKVKVCPLIVMEALACGTPVIGTIFNSSPKALEDSRVACLTEDADIMEKAIENVDKFDRKKCRKIAEENFDSSVMAKKYLMLYEKILAKGVASLEK